MILDYIIAACADSLGMLIVRNLIDLVYTVRVDQNANGGLRTGQGGSARIGMRVRACVGSPAPHLNWGHRQKILSLRCFINALRDASKHLSIRPPFVQRWFCGDTRVRAII